MLNCLTGGSIKSAIAWTRNGIFLDLARDGRRMIKPNGSLYFSEIIHDEDEGIYQCEALSSNDMGLDYQILSRTAHLIVAGKRTVSISKVFSTRIFYDCITWRSLFQATTTTTTTKNKLCVFFLKTRDEKRFLDF